MNGIIVERDGPLTTVTINRPEVRNAFRTTTVAELTDAFLDARWDGAIGVVVLTGRNVAATVLKEVGSQMSELR